jgi:hypothetical protein
MKMSLLKFERPVIKNLGVIATEITKFNRGTSEAHDDVDLWNAPSECHGLVQKFIDKEFDKLEKKIIDNYGLTIDELHNEIVKRTTGRWTYYNQL